MDGSTRNSETTTAALEEFKNIHDITRNMAVTDSFGLGWPCLMHNDPQSGAALRVHICNSILDGLYLPRVAETSGFAFLHEFNVSIYVCEIQDEGATSLPYGTLTNGHQCLQSMPRLVDTRAWVVLPRSSISCRFQHHSLQERAVSCDPGVSG